MLKSLTIAIKKNKKKNFSIGKNYDQTESRINKISEISKMRQVLAHS